MGKALGGPFGKIVNKTGNLVFRKIKGINVVSEYVPHPRNPKSPSQEYHRGIMQRISRELVTGVHQPTKKLYSKYKTLERPLQKLVSDTILDINRNAIPDIIVPVFIPGTAKFALPSVASYNPFFDDLSIQLPIASDLNNNKCPLIFGMTFHPYLNSWQIMPEMRSAPANYTGCCHMCWLEDDGVLECAEFANWVICGSLVYFLADNSNFSGGAQDYSLGILDNVFPGKLKVEKPDDPLPLIVASETNIKELMNFVPGLGYSDKLRKGQTFTPTTLNQLSGNSFSYSCQQNFTTQIYENVPFHEFKRLKNRINRNTIEPSWVEVPTLDLSKFDLSTVYDVLGTINIKIHFFYLIADGENKFTLSLSSFFPCNLPSDLPYGSNPGTFPMPLILVYENLNTGEKWLDFSALWYKTDEEHILSQLEYYFNQNPQRVNTKTGGPGVFGTILCNNGEKIFRYKNVALTLYDEKDHELWTGTSDNFGNFFIQFTNEELNIIGLGQDRKSHTRGAKFIGRMAKKLKAVVDEVETLFEINIPLTGNCFTNFGTFIIGNKS